MTERWARFDTESNVLDNLEKMAMFLSRVRENPEDWKWVVISCFSALYSYAIQVAKGTDDLSVLEGKEGKQRLISFQKALEYCEVPIGARGALELTEEEKTSIEKIQKVFRNNFEHFNPGSWSIEISGFPQHVLNALSVIRRLAVDHNFYTHLDEAQRERLHQALASCGKLAMQLRDEYT